MAPTAIFRADAGPQIGGGHVQRCLALAETMVLQGWRCGFAFRGTTRETVPALEKSGHLLLPMTGPEDSEVAEISVLLGRKCDLFIVDHYHRGFQFEAESREFASRIMAIEDRPVRSHDCDFLLDPTPGRSLADYGALVRRDCRLLLGPGYALLRRQFADARPAAVVRHEGGHPVSRLLVSMGMTDPQNLTATVLQGIKESGLALSLDVVLGSAAPHLPAVRRAAAPLDAHIHVDVADMAGLMSAADLAIAASGSTVLECCCLGLPDIAIVTAENQRHLANAFAVANAAEVLNVHDITPPLITQTLTRLCSDAVARATMSRTAAALCDGQGARRTMDVLSQ